MAEHTPAPTPARSLYGFFLYLSSKTVLVIYFIWAFVPDYWLHYFNIYYYPEKYWSTAIPIQCLVALTLFAFLIYPGTNLMLNNNIDSYYTIADPIGSNNAKKKAVMKSITKNCICFDKHQCMKHCYSPNTQEYKVPQLQDIDFRLVSRMLYSKM